MARPPCTLLPFRQDTRTLHLQANLRGFALQAIPIVRTLCCSKLYHCISAAYNIQPKRRTAYNIQPKRSKDQSEIVKNQLDPNNHSSVLESKLYNFGEALSGTLIMAKAGKITLHGFHSSSCSWRVRLALDFKGIPYEYRAWNISAGVHFSEEYKKISPLQFVPSLEIDGAVLNDSIAIMEYLEERFPEKPLLPKNLVEKAAVRSFVNIIASGIQPLQNLRVLKSIAAMAGDDARVEWAQKWITSGFEALEAITKETAGKYCFGDEFTMADVVFVAQLGNAHRFKVDMGKFPTLEKLERNLFQLELVKNSTPENMPDFPKD